MSEWQPISTAPREIAESAFELGWRTAANWMGRDDLIYDIGSPAYISDRDKAIDQMPLPAPPEGGEG